MRGAVRLLP